MFASHIVTSVLEEYVNAQVYKLERRTLRVDPTVPCNDF